MELAGDGEVGSAGGAELGVGAWCRYCLWEIIEKLREINDNTEPTSLREENGNLPPGNLTGLCCCCR